MVIPYVNYHKLAKVTNKYCSHFDKTLENCGCQRLQDNARKHTTNQRKPVFFYIELMCIHFGLNRTS